MNDQGQHETTTAPSTARELTIEQEARTEPGSSHDARNGIVVTRLAELPEKALLDERALAEALGLTKRTIRRMVARYELPPPISIGGRSRWFAGAVLEHFEAEAERAARKAEAAAKKIRFSH